MGVFDKFRRNRNPKEEQKKKLFEDIFGELQTDMVSICNEYAEGLADKIYVHCYITNDAYAADHFYEVNGDIIPKHKLGEHTNGVVDTSPDRQKRCGKILMDDLTQIIQAFRDDNRRMPYELRIVYNAKKNSMDAHYEYLPIPDDLEELLPNEIMKLWMDELKGDLNPGEIRNIKEYDFGLVEGKTTSDKWGNDFKLVCDKREQFPYAQKCLAYLDSMSADMEGRLRKYLYRYYEDVASWIDEEEVNAIGPISEDTVMEHIHIGSVIVGDSCRQDRIEFHIEGTCDWEPEHGLEITISDDKILYVGPYEDYEPNKQRLSYALEHYGYYDPDADPIMNYADKE